MSKASTQGGDDGQDRGRHRGMPLARTRWAIAGVILGVLGSSWVGVGRGRPGAGDAAAGAPAEADGSAAEPDNPIDGTVRKVRRGIEAASTNVRDRIETAKETSRKAALVAAVNQRLRQDKALDSSRIDVSVGDEGTVILEGQVPDDASKEMAVDLARDIRGVDQVEDHLAVPPKPRVIAAASDDDPATPARPRRVR